MGSIVSSRLDYINKNPQKSTSFGEIEHELDHLKKREQVSGLVAVASTILLVVVLAGVLGGGHIILGALAAVALVAAAYNHFCRQAEASLRERQVALVEPGKTPIEMTKPATESIKDRFLSYFK